MGYNFKVDSIYYNTTGNGTVEVTYLSTIHPGSYCDDIVIPDSVTFRDRTYRVTAIGDQAFESCIYLNNVSLPFSIERIGEYAFRHCISLKNITIPPLVTSLGDYAFLDCDNITNVVCLSVTPPSIVGNYTFTCCANATLHVLPESVGAYQAALYWQDFSQILGDATIEILEDVNYDGVVNIADANSVIDVIINGGSNGHGRVPGDGDAHVTSVYGDVNGDDVVNITDLNIIINRIINN